MTTSSTETSTISSADLRASLDIIEVKPGLKFSRRALQSLLPDAETTLFFGKVYELDHRQLSNLLLVTCGDSDVVHALLGEGGTHSTDLQDYVIDLLDFIPSMDEGDVNFDPEVPKGEFLPELWKSLEVEVAASIKAVADKLGSVVHAMPGKQAEMVFRSMSIMNKKRPTIGDFKAQIHHAPAKPNLVILDVSGSMNSSTVQRIVDDVVSLSYMADAGLAIVSDTCTYWEPGSYDSSDVLRAAEYGGTHYEQLAPLFGQDWGTVVTIADYDSAIDARSVIRSCPGRIDEVLDLSLVGRPTFLAECVGQIATEVRPLLVAATQGMLRN